MELLATGCGDGIWPRCLKKGIRQIPGGKVPSQVTSHDGDVYNLQASKGRHLQMPDAGEGDRETGISSSCVLPEASGRAAVRYRELD